MSHRTAMELKHHHLIMVSLACLLFGEHVTCVQVMKADIGHDIDITWPIRHLLARYIGMAEIQRYDGGTTKRIFYCFDFVHCLHRPLDERVGMATVPQLNGTNNGEDKQITRVGFFVKNVSVSDVGKYRFLYDGYNQLKRDVMLYVYQMPSKPTITSSMLMNEVTVTCNSTLRSLPKEHRTNSELEYIWKLNGSQDNYDIDGKSVTIRNPRKANYGTMFTCKAREVNSTVWSAESDTFFLNSPYLENIDINTVHWLNTSTKVTLVCRADCNPECQYRWTDLDGRFIGKRSNITLLIKEVDSVSCHVINVLGTLTKSAGITVNKGTSCSTSVIASLGVFLTLSIGVAGVLGAMLLLHILKQKRESVQLEMSASPSQVEQSSTRVVRTYDRLNASAATSDLSPGCYESLKWT